MPHLLQKNNNALYLYVSKKFVVAMHFSYIHSSYLGVNVNVNVYYGNYDRRKKIPVKRVKSNRKWIGHR